MGDKKKEKRREESKNLQRNKRNLNYDTELRDSFKTKLSFLYSLQSTLYSTEKFVV